MLVGLGESREDTVLLELGAGLGDGTEAELRDWNLCRSDPKRVPGGAVPALVCFVIQNCGGAGLKIKEKFSRGI